MSTPTERRVDGINAVWSALLNVDNGSSLKAETTREDSAKSVRNLADLGRSPKWKSAVEKWAQMIEDENNPLDWAIVQGAIFTNYSA